MEVIDSMKNIKYFTGWVPQVYYFASFAVAEEYSHLSASSETREHKLMSRGYREGGNLLYLFRDNDCTWLR